MGGVIIALPKQEDARNISNVLKRYGLEVDFLCTTGSSALSYANRLDSGVIICGARFSDMHYTELAEQLPDFVEMLLIASPTVVENCTLRITALSLPFRGGDLARRTEEVLVHQYKRYRKAHPVPKKRSPQEQKLIDDAKLALMAKEGMTEQEAFRYIQKCSMDSGTNMVETAQMVMALMGSK